MVNLTATKNHNWMLYLLIFFPVVGLFLHIIYIFLAGHNVVYADYIRVTNWYLGTGGLPSWSLMWKPTAGHRILGWFPILFLNVSIFKLNTTFDMLLGVFSIFLSSLVLIKHSWDKKLKLWQVLLIIFLLYSLNQWELMLNGIGWFSFFSFTLIYFYFMMLDKALINKNIPPSAFISFLLFPIVIIFGFAGGYSLAFTLSSLSILLFVFLIEKNLTKQLKSFLILTVIVFLLSILIYSNGITQNAIHGNAPLFSLLKKVDLIYLIKFLLASFASTIMGVETFSSKINHEGLLMLFGLFVIMAYVLSLAIFLKKRMYKTTLFPLFLVLFSLWNHLIILISRFSFNNVYYGMSSRYTPPFLFGVIGIVIIISLYLNNGDNKGKLKKILIGGFFFLPFLIGHCVTIKDELVKAPYRKIFFKNLEKTILTYKNRTNSELSTLHPNGNGALARSALEILERRHLNVFRK